MKRIITACAIIYKKTDDEYKILLTKRSFNSSFLPGCYEIPGGHIESGEEILDGLKREIREELNLNIKIGKLFDSFTYQNKGEEVIEYIYLATTTSPLTDIRIQEDEVDSYLWVKQIEINTIVASNKNPNDPEIKILKNAFAYLENKLNLKKGVD